MLSQQILKHITIGLLLSLLVSCGKTDKAKSESQIVARVNDDEISVHQLNFALSRAGVKGEEQAKQITSQLLQRLIDRTALVQQAKAEKLDRDATVLLALEEAKNQVLSQAWLERHARGNDKPTANEVADFNKAHPELFEKRKIYQLKELLIESKAENQQQLENLLQTSGDVNALAANLTAQKISYKENQTTLAAEKLPMEHLPGLYALSNGQYIKVQNEKGLLIMGVLSANESPIDTAKATLFIETYLVNEKRKKQAEAELKRLRDAASIEYLGKFASLNKTDGKTMAEIEPQPASKPNIAPTNASITKGVIGLK